MRTLGFALIWFGGFAAGYGVGAYHKLHYAQRQSIAIDFMCNPQQHWKGIKLFCGERVMDSDWKK